MITYDGSPSHGAKDKHFEIVADGLRHSSVLVRQSFITIERAGVKPEPIST